MPVELLLNIPQALHAVLSLRAIAGDRKRRRMVEQSVTRRGKAVATTILAPHPNGDPAARWSIDEDVEATTQKVNEALQVGEKFVTLKVEGKDRAFIAADIRSIFEE